MKDFTEIDNKRMKAVVQLHELCTAFVRVSKQKAKLPNLYFEGDIELEKALYVLDTLLYRIQTNLWPDLQATLMDVGMQPISEYVSYYNEIAEFMEHNPDIDGLGIATVGTPLK